MCLSLSLESAGSDRDIICASASLLKTYATTLRSPLLFASDSVSHVFGQIQALSNRVPLSLSVAILEAAAVLLLLPFHGVSQDQQMWEGRESILRGLIGPHVYVIIQKEQEALRGEAGDVGPLKVSYSVLSKILRFLAVESATPKNMFFAVGIADILRPSSSLLKVSFPLMTILVCKMDSQSFRFTWRSLRCARFF
jgi:hypothetical protein